MKLINNQTRIQIIEVSCILFVILFLYTGISKLLDFENFQLELQKSPLLSDYYMTISIGIPLCEILIGIGLLWKKTRLFSILSFMFLMTLFTAYIYTVLNYTGYIPCSCGGVIESLGWTEHLIFNSIFILLAINAIIIYPLKNLKYTQEILLRNE